MKSKVGLLLSCGLLVMVAARYLPAEDKPRSETKKPVDPQEPARAADEAAIRKQSAAFMRALEKGDAKEVADQWTTEGEYVSGDGTTIRGRAAIEKAYSKYFATKPTLRTEARIDSIRFLGRDTAVEEGYVKVLKGKKSQPASSRYSVLYVREGDQWRVAVLREHPEEGINLRDLDWLVGSWSAKVGDSEVRTTYEWGESKKFIHVHATIKDSDRTVTLTQMIGKDPRSGLLRSWLFESEGGFGEATWSWDGKHWSLDATGVQADGSEMTSTNLLTPLDKDSFTWQSVERTVDGEEVPDLPPVKVTRVK